MHGLCKLCSFSLAERKARKVAKEAVRKGALRKLHVINCVNLVKLKLKADLKNL